MASGEAAASDALSAEDPEAITPLEMDYIKNQNPYDKEAYLNFLKQVQARLALRKINTTLVVAPDKASAADHEEDIWLALDPTGDNDFNRLAEDLEPQGYTIRYLSQDQLAHPYNSRYTMLTDDITKRWYFSANAFDDAKIMSSYVIRNNLDIISGKYLPPLAATSLQNFDFSFINTKLLPKSSFPELLPEVSYIIHDKKQIYVVKNSSKNTRINPQKSYRLIDYHRANQKISSYAKRLLRNLKLGKDLVDYHRAKVATYYFSLLEDLSWFTLNLNAAVYTLIEQPWNVKYSKTKDGQRLKIAIYPSDYSTYHYTLTIPWAPAMPLDGNTSPILNLAEFRMMVHYYTHLHSILYDMMDSIQNVPHLKRSDFYELLVKLSGLNRLPLAMAREVASTTLELNGLRATIEETQNHALLYLKSKDALPA
ncbi:MAG: hypothetical protein J6Y94_08710, partial [Bacteriovoracaceae bacterium]|nr:hypothetical protein [Bacteriovoracaceae bacterium]